MTDAEILDRFNAVMRAQEQMTAEYEHEAVEVPPGSPQVRYFEEGDQWCPRGAVLRCLIDDEDGEAVITIDDQELSQQQFSRLLTTHSGWGMRIVFVPDDEIEQQPRVEVREPEDGAGSNQSGGNGRPRQME